MTKYKSATVINVHIWGAHVGAVTQQPSGYYGFAYTDNFKKMGIELSPIHLNTKSPLLVRQFPELSETYNKLPALLSDSLPDKFGTQLIRKYFQDLGINDDQITPLDKLAYMGNRSMGALEFKPSKGPRSSKATAIKIKELREAASNIVNGSLDPSYAKSSLSQILKVGTSAGGARAKAILAWNPQTNDFLTGQSECPEGYESWLFKFDGVTNDVLGDPKFYGRIEYAYHLMARSSGIKMFPCRLLEENGRAHFMTKRFDRENGDKHHLQTLCAMSHLDFNHPTGNSYAQYFATIKKLNLPREDSEEAFRRMVFNVLSANCDDHSKNFSFILRKGSDWRISPAYDLTFHYVPGRPWFSHHCMSVNSKVESITKKDILADAFKSDIPDAPRIIDQVISGISGWEKFAEESAIPTKDIQRIKNEHESILIKGGF